MLEINAGDRLHQLRKKRGLSLEEVGLGVGVTSSHISQIENGKRQPSFTLLADLAEYFDMDPTFFIETPYKFFGHGRKIRQSREDRGITLEELAHKAGLDCTYLQLVESGVKQLTNEELMCVAEALDMDMINFLDCIDVHLSTIREICAIVFQMDEMDIDQTIEFIRKRIRSEQ